MMRLLLLAVVVVVAAGGCPLTAYPDRAIPCRPDGEPCPEGLRCVDPDGGGHRCFEIGCGDGIVDLETEQCDDANDNELDLCVRCATVTYTPVLDDIFGFGPGGAVAKGSPLGRPTTIAVDLDGNVLLGSAGTNIVTRLVPGADGFNVAQFGGNGTMLGNDVIADNDRPNEMSTTFVTSMAVDTFGSVFLGDFQDSVIRRVDAVTGLVDTVAGTGVRRSIDDDFTRGTETDIELPASLLVDGDGSLLFTEKAPGGLSGERLRRFDPATGLISTVPLPGVGSTTIDDVVFDRRGRLHVFAHEALFRIDNETLDAFIVVTTYARSGGAFTDPLVRGLRLRRETLDPTEPTGVRTDVFVPAGIGTGQAHIVTDDGDRFYVLMGNNVAELNLFVPENPVLEIVATVPDPVDDSGGGGIFGAGDAGGAAIPFAFAPTDLALHDGQLLVTDPGNGVVWRFPTTRRQDVDGAPGDADVVAGILPPPASVPVTDVINDIAVGFARESDGHVGVGASDDCGAVNLLDARSIEFYVAFPDLHRVLFSNCDSSIGILAGTGAPGFSGDGGLAENAQLDTPTAFVRIDRPRPDGSVDDAFYVADRKNDRIRRIFLQNVEDEPARACVLDGECGVGFVCQRPEGAAPMDPGRCAKPSLFIETFMTSALGVPLRRPSGLAVDDTRALLIADSGNHRVLRRDLETGETTIIFGTGQVGDDDGATATTTTLEEPTSIAYLPLALLDLLAELGGEPLPIQLSGGLVVVTDRARHRVQAAFVPPVPGFPEVLTLAGDGTPGDDDNATDGTAGRLSLPRSIMFSIPDVEQQQLSFFVIDAIDRVRQLTLSVDLGRLALLTGLTTLEGAGRPSRSDGARSEATFRSPSALAFLDPERLLVVDRATGRLRLVQRGGDGDVVTVAGLPEAPAPATSAVTDGPGAAPPALTSAPLRDPTDIVLQLDVDPPVAWVAEADRLRRIFLTDVDAPATWTTDGVDFDGLVRPAALAIDAGVLYIADDGAHAVFRIDTATGQVDVVAGRPGVRGDAGDERPATEALLNEPAGVAVRDDVLLIADTGNNRVRRVVLAPTGDGVITAFLGDGDPASGGEGRPAAAFPVLAPRGLAIDEAGNVVVAASNVVRFVQAGSKRVADATDDVRSIYGKAPRVAFPDSATRCLDDVVFAPGGSAREVVTIDGCLGLVIPLGARGAP